MTDNLDRLIN